ncbi:MAG: zinc ribbon domain-containing protein [Thermoplasmata archaeon]|nr:zinc ribbon domain-containing protein [Thermoplasmata archaeon]
MATVRAAALVRGHGRGASGAGDLAPDEDAFTLLVEAAERVLRPEAPSEVTAPVSVSVWGALPPGALEELPLALGVTSVAPRLEAGGVATFAERLAEPQPAAQLLLAVEASGSAAAVALLTGPAGEESGVEISGADGPEVFEAPGKWDSPVRLAWTLLQPPPPDGSRAVSLPGARLVLRARRLGPFAGEESWTNPSASPEGNVPGAVPVGEPDLSTVSEGAYLPAATYRENLPSRWRLEAAHCRNCGRLSFPARSACSSCGSMQELEPFPLPLRGGIIEAVTTVRPGAQPSEFDFQVQRGGAYDVLLVRLHPEVRVTLQLTGSGAASARIGDRVDTVLRRLYPMEGAWRYGRKAVPSGRSPS